MIRRLLLLNGLAVLAVPFHHATAYGFMAMFQLTNRYRDVTVPNYDMVGSLPYYVTLFIRQIDAFAIPAFLFVSGFFVAFAAGTGQSKLKWETVTTRVQNLFWPFAVWTVLFFLMLRSAPSTLNEILRAYYYIPLVSQYYLFSPLLVPIARNKWKLLLIVAAVMQLAVQGFTYLRILGVDFPGLDQLIMWTPIWFFPSRIFYFALGLVVGFHRQPFTAWLVSKKWTLLVTVTLLPILSMVEYELVAYITGNDWLGPNFAGIARTLYATLFSLCFLSFADVTIPFSKELSYLASKSLGVYLINTPAIYVFGTLMYKFTPWALGHQLLYQSVLIVVGLAVPLLLMATVSKSPARVVYRHVFG